VVRDPGFLDPMEHYEQVYREYFQLFCEANFAENAAGQAALLPLLKQQLEECRAAVMNRADSSKRLLRDAELRRATGDTMRLRTLASRAG